MEIKKFVEEYTKETDEAKRDELINKHIVRDYIPYVTKASTARNIVNSICYENNVFKIDTPTLVFSFVISATKMYTDLEFDKENPTSDFDLMEKNNLNAKMRDAIGDDYKVFESILYAVEDDVEKSENNMVTFMKTMSNQITDYFSSDDFKKTISEIASGATS